MASEPVGARCQGEGNLIGGWAYAARVTGQGVVATGYMDGDTPNYGHFSYLCAAIDQVRAEAAPLGFRCHQRLTGVCRCS
eukprot:COSAG04_NODE_163_length_21807_cov_8.304580_11_plen_80_part_00